MMHACIYLHARLAIPTTGSPMRARPSHALRPCCVRVSARVRACDWAPTHPRRHMRARLVGVDRGWLGSQAFYSASAFNADIGAWNTASVSTMANVCAAFSARAARHRGRDGLGGSSARRRRRCALACVCADVWARACADVPLCR
jgi:surface protein